MPTGPTTAHTMGEGDFFGRFYGWIAGVGTSSGTRLVLGHWVRTPFGPFSDVMVAHPDGRRELLAPSAELGAFVAGTYQFDDLSVVPVRVEPDPCSAAGASLPGGWRITAGALRWTFETGPRHPLGPLLAAIPLRLAGTAAFARLADPVARVVMPGVRTIGRAGGGSRTEWYTGRDLHRITASSARWDGRSLGELTPVSPPPRFGFSATPATPTLTRVLTTISDRTPRRAGFRPTERPAGPLSSRPNAPPGRLSPHRTPRRAESSPHRTPGRAESDGESPC